MEYLEELYNSKYHLSVAQRLFSNYDEFHEKRFLVGVINELAMASGALIRAYLMREKKKSRDPIQNLEVFMKIIGPKYLSSEVLDGIFKSLEIERAQKESPIEFARGEKIILLVNKKYRILTKDRLFEFILAVEKGIKGFSL